MSVYTNAVEMFEDMGLYASEHPNCEFTLEDDAMKRIIGYRSESETWSIGLTNLKRSLPGLSFEAVSLIGTLEGRAKLAEMAKQGRSFRAPVV